MSDEYNTPEEDELTLEEVCEQDNEALEKLHELLSLESVVYSNNAVSKDIMHSLENISSEAVENVNFNSYTKELSEQNLQESLESFSVAKGILVSAAVAVFGALLFALIKFFRGSSSSTNIDEANGNIKVAEQLEKTIEETENNIKDQNEEIVKDPNQPGDEVKKAKGVLRSLKDYDEEFEINIRDNANKCSKEALDFINLMVGNNSKILSSLIRYSSSIESLLGDFHANITELLDVYNKLEKALEEGKSNQIQGLITRVDRLDKNMNESFFNDVSNIIRDLIDASYSNMEEYKTFIAETVRGCKEYVDVAFHRDKWQHIPNSIEPKGNKDIDKHLDEIEATAKEISRKRDNTNDSYQEYVKRQQEKSEDGSYDNNSEQQELNRVLSNVDRKIRMNVAAFKDYNGILLRVSMFYKMISIDHKTILEKKRKALDHIARGIDTSKIDL